MQNALLDILILGLLVLLFASIYKKRASRRLRFWVLGWLFVLLHFASLLLNPATDLGQNLVLIGVFGSLLLAGVAFILASTSLCFGGRRSIIPILMLSLPGLFFIATALLAPNNRTLLYTGIVLVES